MQKHLKGVMGTTGATFVRFGFGCPFALLFVGVLHSGFGYGLPAVNCGILRLGVLADLDKIFATFLLVHLFSFCNFAVGTAVFANRAGTGGTFRAYLPGERVTLGAIRCNRHQRAWRDADFGRPCGGELSQHAGVHRQPQRVDRACLRYGVRRFRRRLPGRLAGAWRAESS